MRVIYGWWGVLTAMLLASSGAAAIPILPEGTSVAGQPTSLLGYDAALNDYVTGGMSAVSDSNIEFLTADFALALDFSSGGLLRLSDNLGTGNDDFNYTLRFAFSGLAAPLASLRLQDVSNLTAGNVFFNILDRDTFELSLRDVRFAPGFTFADVAITVDEPPAVALLVLGLMGLLAMATRRRHSCAAEVAP